MRRALPSSSHASGPSPIPVDLEKDGALREQEGIRCVL